MKERMTITLTETGTLTAGALEVARVMFDMGKTREGITNLNAQIGRRLPPMVDDFTMFFIGFALGALNQNPK